MGNKLAQVTQTLRTKGIKVWLHDGLHGHTTSTEPEQTHTRAGVGFMWGPGIQLVSEPCVIIPGRCSLGKFLLPKGCTISVYSLYADVRSSTNATDQLSMVIELARKDPTPTIIAGDFNLHPEEVEQTVKALAGTRNDLMLWIPPKPTYFSGEHTSTLDYMLTVNMPRALLHGFRICPEVDIGQHKAIEASLGTTQVEEEFDLWKKGTRPHHMPVLGPHLPWPHAPVLDPASPDMDLNVPFEEWVDAITPNFKSTYGTSSSFALTFDYQKHRSRK